MTPKRLFTMLAIALILGAPASGRGDDATTDIAKQHYLLGEKLFNVSRYSEALSEFEKAYKLFPSPLLIFNIARCHELLAQLEKSIEYYERFLKMDPEASGASVIRARIVALKERLDAMKKESLERDTAREGAAIRPVRGTGTETERPTAGDEPAGGGTRWTGVVGWTAVGVGAATVVTGIILGGLAAARGSEFETGVTDGLEYSELMAIKDSGEGYETAQIATIVVGSVVTAAGVGLLLWDRSRARQERGAGLPFVVPYVTASGAGLSGCARF